MNTELSLLQRIETSWTKAHDVALFLKRDDLIHAEVSGNKWRKLKYFFEQFQQHKSAGILTFGGAFSNHLVATASFCHSKGIRSIGIVRGEELNASSNESLRFCADRGMDLHFISREEYAMKDDRSFKEHLLDRFPNFYQIPEGGAAYLGMLGCQEIIPEIRKEIDFDAIFVAQGTTTTSCGLALACREEELHVVPVLKGFDAKSEMANLLSRSAFDTTFIHDLLEDVNVHLGFDFGGYAQVDEELLNFIRTFYLETNVSLDPVYTAKTMFALRAAVLQGKFSHRTVVFLHTGGVQGAKSYSDKYGELYPMA